MNRNFPSTLYGAFFLLLVAPACLGDLMCFVCNDCPKVDKNTPLLACNEDFFNQGGSTEASTVTTTTMITTSELPSTTIVPSETTTTSLGTTSEPEKTTISDETTGEPIATETTVSTELPMPTPATVGPPETTTGVPTPPTVKPELKQVISIKRWSVNENNTEEAEATDLNIRQRRALIDTGISYHCYTVQRRVNNTTQLDRGCSRVTSEQTVCTELQLQNPSVPISDCDPCSMNACNAATSSLHVSLLMTMVMAITAALLQLK